MAKVRASSSFRSVIKYLKVFSFINADVLVSTFQSVKSTALAPASKKYFESKAVEVVDEEIIMDALTTIEMSKDDEEQISDLSSKIEELDDVQNVYMNASLS